MKKITLFALTGILTLGLLTACAKAPAVTPTPDTQPSATPSEELPEEGTETADVLNKLAALVGKDDAAVIAAFGEGTANMPEGTTDVIGREYNTSVLGEEVTLTVIYNDNKMVDTISIPLSGTEIDVYKTELETEMGTHQSTEGDENEAEGNGRVAYIWTVENTTISLVLTYGAISIEMAPAL